MHASCFAVSNLSQSLVICLAAGHSPSLGILASLVAGVLPTGKFEGRQQLRQGKAVVAVFADHLPPPKLEGIVQATAIEELEAGEEEEGA